jgi:hypothetical protein
LRKNGSKLPSELFIFKENIPVKVEFETKKE